MILRHEIILSVMYYERKIIIFYGKNFKLTKNHTFNNFFGIDFFLTSASYQFLKNNWNFMNHGLFSGKNIPYN